MKNPILLSLLILLIPAAIFYLSACKKKLATDSSPQEEVKKIEEPSKSEGLAKAAQSGEPEHILVQHILIGFQGSLPGKDVKRSRAQAEKLADEIIQKAKDPKANYDSLVKEFTDDQAPGIYGLANLGVSPQGEEFPRDQMVPAFGDVGFKLKAGEIGLAQHDAKTSPYGFHVIKRLK